MPLNKETKIIMDDSNIELKINPAESQTSQSIYF